MSGSVKLSDDLASTSDAYRHSVWDPEGNKYTDMLSAYGSAFVPSFYPYSFPTLYERIIEPTLLGIPRGNDGSYP